MNMSSVFGRSAPAGTGGHSATTYPMEAPSDALRVEAMGFGVRTTLVEPELVHSRFARAALDRLADAPTAYADFHHRPATRYGSDRSNLPGRLTVRHDAVADAVARAVRARRPRAHYPVGPPARGVRTLRRLLPDRGFDAFLRRQFAVP